MVEETISGKGHMTADAAYLDKVCRQSLVPVAVIKGQSRTEGGSWDSEKSCL